MTLKKKAFENIVGKKKMLVTSIFSFSHSVFFLSQANFNFSVTFILSSANAFNLDQFKNLLFGKELKELTSEKKIYKVKLEKLHYINDVLHFEVNTDVLLDGAYNCKQHGNSMSWWSMPVGFNPLPNDWNFVCDQTESICRWQIKQC